MRCHTFGWAKFIEGMKFEDLMKPLSCLLLKWPCLHIYCPKINNGDDCCKNLPFEKNVALRRRKWCQFFVNLAELPWLLGLDSWFWKSFKSSVSVGTESQKNWQTNDSEQIRFVKKTLIDWLKTELDTVRNQEQEIVMFLSGSHIF